MAKEKYPRATVQEVNGKIVLNDPDALVVINALNKQNCRRTLELQMERVQHFKNRMKKKNLTSSEVIIVLINVDAPYGADIAEALMPGTDWQPMRDAGQVPFARGLAGRPFMEEVLGSIDKETQKKLKETKTIAVVVVDHGTAEVFSSKDIELN